MTSSGQLVDAPHAFVGDEHGAARRRECNAPANVFVFMGRLMIAASVMR